MSDSEFKHALIEHLKSGDYLPMGEYDVYYYVSARTILSRLNGRLTGSWFNLSYLSDVLDQMVSDGTLAAKLDERNGERVYYPMNYLNQQVPNDRKDESIEDAPARVESESWTGLPRIGVLGEEAVAKLKIALAVVDDAVTRSNASNEDRAQARAFVLAIHALADAPEPPADLVWELVSRANQLAGISSFFVSLFALFAAVAY